MAVSCTRDRVKKRLFHRISSGIYFHRRKPIRFLTLTSSPKSPDIGKSFKEIVKRIRRKYGNFEYIVIFTNEGYGVAHIIFSGPFIEYDWIKKNWLEIHKAWNIDIQLVKRGLVYDKEIKSYKALTGYLLRQYIVGQSAIRTVNWSRGWCFKGFVKEWNSLKKREKDKGLRIYEWHKILDSKYYLQKKL